MSQSFVFASSLLLLVACASKDAGTESASDELNTERAAAERVAKSTEQGKPCGGPYGSTCLKGFACMRKAADKKAAAGTCVEDVCTENPDACQGLVAVDEDASDDVAKTSCTPGAMVYCRCPDGKEAGTKVCAADGTSFDACAPCD